MYICEPKFYRLCHCQISESSTSAIDSTAWEDTQIVQEHEHIIKDGEWVWADLAYLVCTCMHFHVPDSNLNTTSPTTRFSTTIYLTSVYDPSTQSAFLKGDFSRSRSCASKSRIKCLTTSLHTGCLLCWSAHVCNGM